MKSIIGESGIATIEKVTSVLWYTYIFKNPSNYLATLHVADAFVIQITGEVSEFTLPLCSGPLFIV